MTPIHQGEFGDWIKLFRTRDSIELRAWVETPETATRRGFLFYIALTVITLMVIDYFAIHTGEVQYTFSKNRFLYFAFPIIGLILLYPIYRYSRYERLNISFQGHRTLWHFRDRLGRKRSQALPLGDKLVIRAIPHRLGPVAERDHARRGERKPLPEDKRYYQTAQEIIVHAGLRGAQWVCLAQTVYDESGEKAHALLSAIKQADEDAAMLYRANRMAGRSTVV